MAGFTEYPTNYQLFTSQQSKQLNVAFEIEGLPFVFGVQNTYTKVRYGDPNTFYGQTGLVYGALRVLDNSRPYLMFDSGLTLSQRLEPEQGRGSISQMSLSLIDKDGFVSQVISPGGGILDEILGRPVIIRMGYVQTSYPEDYCVIFRGVITQVQIVAGKVNFSIGDANQKTRSATFKAAKALLTSAIDASTLSIPVNNVLNFYDLIIDQSAVTYSQWRVKPYVKVQDELISYGYGAISGSTITGLARGARNTTAAPHDLATEASNAVEIQGHPLDVALWIMLSGWGGSPWVADVPAQAFGVVIDLNVTPAFNVICLPAGKNADIDYGLVIGDRVQISGSSNGNDGTYTITAFGSSEGFANRLIYLNQNLNVENPTTATLSFYSQFDVLPMNCGLQLTPNDVDIKTFIQYKTQVFNSAEYFMQFYLTNQTVGKSWIEQEIFLPLGAYSLTRYGRLSLGYMKPPIAADKLVVLNANNLVNPEAISVTRGMNNRKFYNQIQYQYDRDDAGNFKTVIRNVDTDSLNRIGILQLLPINSSGLKSAFGGGVLANRVATRLLTRFKKAAYDITVQAQWNPGTFIEAGDGIVLQDNGYLQLTNFATGERDLGTQVLEVTDRTIDLKSGAVRLTLTSGIDNNLNARYGVISPSSQISATGSTASQLKLKKSYGNTGDEIVKWSQLIGSYIEVHSYDYTYREVKRLTGVSQTQPDTVILDSDLSQVPSEDFILDVAPYGSGSDATYNQLVKSVYTSVAPTLTVLTGISTTQFAVSLADFAKVLEGAAIQVRNQNYSLLSPEVTVTQKISPNTIEVSSSLGFTPSSGQRVEIVGFLDTGGAYRLL
jgi:hypothetical protein